MIQILRQKINYNFCKLKIKARFLTSLKVKVIYITPLRKEEKLNLYFSNK